MFGDMLRRPAAIVLFSCLAVWFSPPTAAAGDGVEAAREAFRQGDYAGALQLARPLAEAGLPAAQNLLGVLFEKGLGVERDLETALAWYRRAAGQEYLAALENLGIFWQHGRPGYPPDYERAAEYYERAIALGSARAMNNRAVMHALGQGGPVDDAAAAALYERAAALGHRAAMGNLAQALVEGRGVRRDHARAFALFVTAAQRGHLPSINNLAVMHERGYATPPDPMASFAIYRLAADRGVADAMLNLAFFLIEGDSAFRDPVEGYLWCLRARRAAGGAAYDEDCARLGEAVGEEARAAAVARFEAETR